MQIDVEKIGSHFIRVAVRDSILIVSTRTVADFLGIPTAKLTSIIPKVAKVRGPMREVFVPLDELTLAISRIKNLPDSKVQELFSSLDRVSPLTVPEVTGITQLDRLLAERLELAAVKEKH